MEPGEAGTGEHEALGLAASVRRMVGTVLEIIQTRVELIANEVEEEREHLRALVVYGLATVFFLAIGLLLATLFVILLYWDEHRLAVIGVFAGFYLAVGVIGLLLVRARQRRRSKFLAATLAELRLDRERLQP